MNSTGLKGVILETRQRPWQWRAAVTHGGIVTSAGAGGRQAQQIAIGHEGRIERVIPRVACDSAVTGQTDRSISHVDSMVIGKTRNIVPSVPTMRRMNRHKGSKIHVMAPGSNHAADLGSVGLRPLSVIERERSSLEILSVTIHA